MAGRYRVLMVDPVRMRREKATSVLALRYDIDSADTPREAQAAIRRAKPDAIVLTLRQVEENGLLVAKKLRALVGPGAFVVVHGSTTSVTSAEERRTVLAHHGVDLWAPTHLPPDDLAVVLNSRSALRVRPAATTWWRRLWAYLTRPLPSPTRRFSKSIA